MPIPRDVFLLPKGYDILLTAPLTNPINPKSKFIFNDGVWTRHGYMDPMHSENYGHISSWDEAHWGVDFVERARRSVKDQDRILKDPYRFDKNPNRQILYNKTLAASRATWINDLLKSNLDDKELFLAPYPALSCIGAKVKTWRQLMNFIDCPTYTHDVRQIPLSYLKRIGEPYRAITRRVDQHTGCFKVYRDPPQSIYEVMDYLQDAYSNETLDLLGTQHTGDAWFIDQKLASIRLGQFGKRHGYERIFTHSM